MLVRLGSPLKVFFCWWSTHTHPHTPTPTRKLFHSMPLQLPNDVSVCYSLPLSVGIDFVPCPFSSQPQGGGCRGESYAFSRCKTNAVLLERKKTDPSPLHHHPTTTPSLSFTCFVATDTCLSRQNTSRHIFVTTSLFCCKHVFVATSLAGAVTSIIFCRDESFVATNT